MTFSEPSDLPTIDSPDGAHEFESVLPEGFLIVSGLLNHQVDAIISQYDSLEKITVVSKNDWSAILFKRSF